MLLQILVPYSTVAFELTYRAGKLPLPALHIAGSSSSSRPSRNEYY